MKCRKDLLLLVVCDYYQVSNLLRQISCPKDLIPGKQTLDGILVWVPQSMYIWRQKKQLINHEDWHLKNLSKLYMIEPVYAEIRSLEWPFAPENKSRKKNLYQRYLIGKG